MKVRDLPDDDREKMYAYLRDSVRGFLVTSAESLDAMIDRTALHVLATNSTWPPDLVRRYAEQILSTLGGMPR